MNEPSKLSILEGKRSADAVPLHLKRTDGPVIYVDDRVPFMRLAKALICAGFRLENDGHGNIRIVEGKKR